MTRLLVWPEGGCKLYTCMYFCLSRTSNILTKGMPSCVLCCSQSIWGAPGHNRKCKSQMCRYLPLPITGTISLQHVQLNTNIAPARSARARAVDSVYSAIIQWSLLRIRTQETYTFNFLTSGFYETHLQAITKHRKKKKKRNRDFLWIGIHASHTSFWTQLAPNVPIGAVNYDHGS